jgi:S-adenosylmethionine decarboxylase
MVKNTIKFGQHLIFDGYGCSYTTLNSEEACKRILENIVKLAQMHKLIEPILIEASSNMDLGGKDPGGYTGFVIIQESHISIHTFAKRGFVTIDVYSCKEFPTEDVINYLIQELEPKDYDILSMERGLKYPKDNIY